MADNNESIKDMILNSKKIAICVEDVSSTEIATCLGLLAKFLADRGKEVGVYSAGAIDTQLAEKIENEGFKVENTLKSITYVISIDYGRTGIEKISYDPDEKTGRLNFYITPTSGEFDFENIEYKTEGNDFDTVITIGVTSFKDLGELYDKNRKLFIDSKVISIVKGDSTLGDQSIQVGEDENYLVALKQLIGEDLDEKSANLIADALLGDIQTVDMIGDPDLLSELVELGKYGVDLSDKLNKIFYTKTYSNLDLQIKLMHNVTVDRESRVIWSKLNREELKFCGIDKDNIDLRGRIIFNITDEFDIAFAVYEVARDELEIVVESNDTSKYEASNIAGVFGGKGTPSHATFRVENMPIKDFEKNIFVVLNDMYGLNVKGKAVEFKSSAGNGEKERPNLPPTVGGSKGK
ncbi:hypothetical protein H6763_02960 [Candidatus Nomurabacteria bacterium]|uniref:Uncharacterized protein n=1 Tax=Candidatus Dojkabacteria bacterium TaxID=2099670 RepID=A0A955I9C2_9BACT|nr:hypothetical protein [Candidatus Dojkabacteria bacterium]MCB9789444.1 hypothetical protein [Candidatus Nomurabacteria bacterium]MCB9803766.1 hypothetical protein [Candidatus Nomurabacteria bacterium]